MPAPVTLDLVVRDFHRTISYAGKLGDRIDDVARASASGRTYTIRFFRQHSRNGASQPLTIGAHVQVTGIVDGETITVFAGDVKAP